MISPVKCVSVSYEEWRVFGTIWRYENYKDLLNKLLKDNKVILGGDILVYIEDKQIAYSGSNWYYEGDSPIESNIVAQKYLESLSKWAQKEELLITLEIKPLRSG